MGVGLEKIWVGASHPEAWKLQAGLAKQSLKKVNTCQGDADGGHVEAVFDEAEGGFHGFGWVGSVHGGSWLMMEIIIFQFQCNDFLLFLKNNFTLNRIFAKMV